MEQLGYFMEPYQWFMVYLILINGLTFVVYAIDKRRAIKHKWRIRVTTLLGLAVVGGSLGALASMYAFRHKTNVAVFKVGVPLIILMQSVIVIYSMKLL